MFAVEGKVALITGGLGGIGLEIIQALLKEGVKGISILDKPSPEREQLLKRITDNNPNRIILVHADVTDVSDIDAGFMKTVEEFGSLNLVINLAGIIDEKNWKDCIKVNVIGLVDVSYLAINKYLPKYCNGEESVVVNMSSISGFEPLDFSPIYSTTKHAIVGFSRSMARLITRQRKNIKILTVCPGLTDTPMTSKNYGKRTEEIKTMFKPQEPSFVASSLMNLVAKAEHDTIWIMEAYDCYEIKLPTYATFRVQKD